MQRLLPKIIAFASVMAVGSAFALPDLVVTDIELIPASPDAGEGLVHATITNIGIDDVTLPVFEFVNVTFHRNGIFCDDVVFGELAANDSVTSDSLACNPGTAGTYAITVDVDTDFDVSESNESNNQRTESFDWGVLPDNGIFSDGFENTEIIHYQIGFCRLQFPILIDDTEGTEVDVWGRLYVAGLTDVSELNDPAEAVIGYVGYGPDSSDPSTGWSWVEAAPNPSYGPGSPDYEANDDEYQATLSIPNPPGEYDFAFRFSGDGGATFTYCDSDAGSSDGYNPADAGQMTSRSAADAR